MRRRFAALCIVASLISGTSAEARGDLVQLEKSCVVKAGPDLMYFSAYMPRESHRKFCGDLPSTGGAIFVLDYAQSEMREMAADFRIVRDTGAPEMEAETGETVAYLPPKLYPNGTVSLRHVFPETGNFVGIVTLSGPHGEHWVSRIPFSVGRSWSPRTPYYLLSAAVALALLLLLWGKEGASD